MKLCTACRVRPATVKVGHWPVCGKCGGRTANHVLGIQPYQPHVVGTGISGAVGLAITGLLLGLGLVIGIRLAGHIK